MNYLYSFFIASPSLFSFLGGVLPIWLIFNFYYFCKNLIKDRIRIPNFLFLIPLCSLISFIFNFRESKIGHLIAYFAIFTIAVPSNIYFFSKKNKSKSEIYIYLRNFLTIICLTLFLTSIIDFILLYRNINFANYLPYVGNDPIMSSIFSRSRGFWPEPTDLSLALNVFFPLLLAFHKCKIISFENRIKSYLKEILIIFAWIVSLLLAKSASALFSLSISIFIFQSLKIINRYKNLLKINKYKIFTFIFFLVILILLFFGNNELIDSYRGQVFQKILLSQDNDSVNGRISSWTLAIQNFLEEDFLGLIIGAGPGHFSLVNEKGGMGTVSWIISVVAELGILGLFSLLFLIYKVFSYLRFMPVEMKNYYCISIVSIFIHLFTISAFYLPPLSFVISIPIILGKVAKRELIMRKD